MDSEKYGNSDTSSEENGGQSLTLAPDKSKDHDKAGSRRSYECTFCKRGFTNAQALGGHMNLHRKDKAKAKAEKNSTKSKKNDNLQKGIPNYSSHFTMPINSSIDLQGHYHHHSSSFGAQMNYQAYFSPPNPSYQQGYNCYYSNHFGGYEENLSTNLSLQVGAPSAMENSKGLERDGKEDWLDKQEVDLELRLGHHR